MVVRVQPVRRRRLPWPFELYRSAVGKKWVMAVTGIMLHGLRVRPHGRQPQGLPGRRGPQPLRRVAPGAGHPGPAPHGRPVAHADRPHRRLRAPHPRRLRPHPDEPPGPARRLRRPGATTSPPTSPAARCAGPASSSPSSSSSTCSTSPGARPTPTSSGATRTTTWSHSFDRVPVAILYIVANLALAVHLFHGAWTLFQSLGVNNPRFNRWRRGLRRRLRRCSSWSAT